MGTAESQNTAVEQLYPAISPFHQQMLDVPGGHRIYVEQCGNPKGLPVIVLHGGPGGGCSPAMRRFFNPEVYRIILFDQRGCGRSEPHATVDNNTTWDLVADIERIREVCGIDNWIIFGGSWGATLSLIYAQSHPDRCLHIVLRGVFLLTQTELDWFYGGGAGRFFPDRWQAFCDMIPPPERHDMIAAYAKRLFGDDEKLQLQAARAWSDWETGLATLAARQVQGLTPARFALAFARIENHYFQNLGFLQTDGQILREMPKIAHIPGTIVQGRYDMVCPPQTAYKLNAAWPNSSLLMIPSAGHALSEPGITAALIAAMDHIGDAPPLGSMPVDPD